MKRSHALIALALTVMPLAVAQAQDARGKRLFLQCQACHSVKAGQPHKVGPNLAGTLGAKAATRPNYRYSAALTKSGLVWNDATLDRWLAKPSATVPGNKMIYSGMPKAQDRAALIAYLKFVTR